LLVPLLFEPLPLRFVVPPLKLATFLFCESFVSIGAAKEWRSFED
jgi:hypothetical protein